MPILTQKPGKNFDVIVNIVIKIKTHFVQRTLVSNTSRIFSLARATADERPMTLMCGSERRAYNFFQNYITNQTGSIFEPTLGVYDMGVS